MTLLFSDVFDLGGGVDLFDVDATNLFQLGDMAPIITSNGGGPTASVNVQHGHTAATTVVATGDPAPTFSITGGADAAKFSIVEATGVLTFVDPPDYETPSDDDTDGVYEVEVTATNSGGTDMQAISVTVTEAADSCAAPAFPPAFSPVFSPVFSPARVPPALLMRR